MEVGDDTVGDAVTSVAVGRCVQDWVRSAACRKAGIGREDLMGAWSQVRGDCGTEVLKRWWCMTYALVQTSASETPRCGTIWSLSEHSAWKKRCLHLLMLPLVLTTWPKCTSMKPTMMQPLAFEVGTVYAESGNAGRVA